MAENTSILHSSNPLVNIEPGDMIIRHDDQEVWIILSVDKVYNTGIEFNAWNLQLERTQYLSLSLGWQGYFTLHKAANQETAQTI
jgi:hypothetical protein